MFFPSGAPLHEEAREPHIFVRAGRLITRKPRVFPERGAFSRGSPMFFLSGAPFHEGASCFFRAGRVFTREPHAFSERGASSRGRREPVFDPLH